MRTRTVLLTFCLIGVPVCASAADEVDAVPTDPVSNDHVQAAIEDLNEHVVVPVTLICRRERKRGTHHITRRVCRPAEEVEAESAARARRSGNHGGGGNQAPSSHLPMPPRF